MEGGVIGGLGGGNVLVGAKIPAVGLESMKPSTGLDRLSKRQGVAIYEDR